MLSFAQFLWKCVQFWNSHKLYIEALDSSPENPMFPVNTIRNIVCETFPAQ